MTARIRRRFKRTVNLGYGSNGPMLELATLREYATFLRPKVVLWNFFEGNDLNDLAVETPSPLLRRYFESQFSQELVRRRPEVDSAVSDYIERQLLQPFPGWQKLRGVLTLRRLRAEVDRRAKPWTQRRSMAADIQRFRAVLNRANYLTREWGGHVVLVYLPAPWRYRTVVGQPSEQPLETIRRFVVKMARDDKIPLVDIHDVFSTNENLDDLLYPFVAHYTASGYAVAADAIIKYLESTGWLDQ